MSLATDRLIGNARVHLPGATDSTIQYELFNVLDEFFDFSNIWQEQIPFGVTVPTSTPSPVTPITYPIEQSSVSTILRLIGVVDSNGRPVASHMDEPGDIVLHAPPGQADTYTVTVSLTVADPVSSKTNLPEFPDWIATKYGRGILDGVLGRMMAQPAKPYTNLQLAEVRTRSFISTRSKAKIEALHGLRNNGQTWCFPQQFRTRQRRF